MASVTDGLTWRAIDAALSRGARGLPGGSTLCRLLAEERDVRPELSHEQILAWADAFHAAHGGWPHTASGPVEEAPGETWQANRLQRPTRSSTVHA